MKDSNLEVVEFQVPANTGPLIGNTLRQFAMRANSTWQVAGYKLGNKEGSFGLSGNTDFSYHVFLHGALISPSGTPTTTEKVCKFTRSGEDYICGNYVVKNLGRLDIPEFEACLVYASGSRTVEQNCTTIRKLCPSAVSDYVIVPSRHTPVVTFKYQVRPFTQEQDILIIETAPGIVMTAIQSALTLLHSLSSSPNRGGA